MTPSMTLGRIRSMTPPPLVTLAVVLATATVYGYVLGEHATAILLGVATILSSLFFLLTRR